MPYSSGYARLEDNWNIKEADPEASGWSYLQLQAHQSGVNRCQWLTCEFVLPNTAITE